MNRLFARLLLWLIKALAFTLVAGLFALLYWLDHVRFVL